MGKYDGNIQRVRVMLGINVIKRIEGFKDLRYLITKHRTDMEILFSSRITAVSGKRGRLCEA